VAEDPYVLAVTLIRLRFGQWVDRVNLMRDRVARDIEPAPATARMVPAFEKQPFRVVTHVQIVGPFGVAERLGIRRSRDMALTAAMKLGFVALAAPGAGDQQHDRILVRNAGGAVLVDEIAAVEPRNGKRC